MVIWALHISHVAINGSQSFDVNLFEDEDFEGP